MKSSQIRGLATMLSGRSLSNVPPCTGRKGRRRGRPAAIRARIADVQRGLLRDALGLGQTGRRAEIADQVAKILIKVFAEGGVFRKLATQDVNTVGNTNVAYDTTLFPSTEISITAGGTQFEVLVAGVYQIENGEPKLLPRPDRDEITKVF